ncbi:hypothetical protein ACFQFG_11250 [Methylobacterium persicinum]
MPTREGGQTVGEHQGRGRVAARGVDEQPAHREVGRGRAGRVAMEDVDRHGHRRGRVPAQGLRPAPVVQEQRGPSDRSLDLGDGRGRDLARIASAPHGQWLTGRGRGSGDPGPPRASALAHRHPLSSELDMAPRSGARPGGEGREGKGWKAEWPGPAA